MESNTGNGKSTRKGVKPTLLLLLLQGGFKMTPFGSLSWRENIFVFSKYDHLWSFSVIPQWMVGLISLCFELELGQMTSTHC